MASPKGHPPYPGCETGGKPPVHTLEFIENEAEALLKWMKDKNNKCIFLTEFALERGYSRQRLPEFARKSEKFAVVLDMAKNWQEMKLTTGALTKKYEPGFCKFVMPRVCGEEWKEEKNLKITTNGPIPAWIAEAEGKSKDLVDE